MERFFVDYLQAVDPEFLSNVDGVTVTVDPELDSMHLHRVCVEAPTREGLIAYCRENWDAVGDEDWFRSMVLDRIVDREDRCPDCGVLLIGQPLTDHQPNCAGRPQDEEEEMNEAVLQAKEIVRGTGTAGVTLDQINRTVAKIEASIKEWEEGRMTSPDDRDHVIAACEVLNLDWIQIDRGSDNDIIGKIATEVYEDSGETITDIPDLATYILTRLFQEGLRPVEEEAFYLDAHYRDGAAGYGVVRRSDYKVVQWFHAPKYKDAEELRDKLNAGEVEVEVHDRTILVHVNVTLPGESNFTAAQVMQDVQGALEIAHGDESAADHVPALAAAREWCIPMAEEI